MKHATILLWTVLVLVGCASAPSMSPDERLNLYLAHSTPVESFRTAKTEGRQVRWSAIGEKAVLVYDESDQPHVLELQQECSGLANARSISLTNTAGTVTPGTDTVRIVGASKAGAATSCRISSARRVDMDAVKKAREQSK